MRDARRERILSAAVRLFAVRGLGGTKISDIASAAEMSQGLMYHYFKSKEEIFTAIVGLAFERMNDAARGLERSPLSPREKLETMVREIVRSIKESDDFVWWSALVSTASISDTIPEAAKATIRLERDVPYEVVARIVSDGQAEGTVRPGKPADLALVFWTAVKGLALHKAALGAAFRPPSIDILGGIFFNTE
jgi:AcrR family transcriptional regulator